MAKALSPSFCRYYIPKNAPMINYEATSKNVSLSRERKGKLVRTRAFGKRWKNKWSVLARCKKRETLRGKIRFSFLFFSILLYRALNVHYRTAFFILDFADFCSLSLSLSLSRSLARFVLSSGDFFLILILFRFPSFPRSFSSTCTAPLIIPPNSKNGCR